MTKKKILFVCLGNICRSPAAEGIMSRMIKFEGLENQIEVDSAGTIAYHTGEHADPRMRKHASQRGYDLTSLARKFNPEKDFKKFDYIITMDNQNYEDVLSIDIKNEYAFKVFKMVQFCKSHKVDAVPDPYYSGSEGFENVLDILEDGCQNLLKKIKNEIK
ncbi:MAG: low molecular weight protein-tyrosine-phosphatase [Ignavibacteriaceae bacterium]